MPAIALDSVRAGSSTTPASSNFLRIYLTYQSVLFGIVVWVSEISLIALYIRSIRIFMLRCSISHYRLLTLLSQDWLVCLRQEYKHVWKGRFCFALSSASRQSLAIISTEKSQLRTNASTFSSLIAKISINKVLYLMSRYVSLALTAAVFGLNYVSSDVKECNLLVRFNCAAIALTQAICELS